MALIPPSGIIQATMIDHDFVVIKNGGTDEEQVMHRIFMGHQQSLAQGQLTILRDPNLDEEEKFHIGFWFGYFYAHDLRSS